MPLYEVRLRHEGVWEVEADTEDEAHQAAELEATDSAMQCGWDVIEMKVLGNICQRCGIMYPEAGDGYGDLCPDCADARDQED